ncbi:MAG: dTDP-4-dehydrorhamnose reductase [Planctomycetota bacterium]|jgi:dTDP-4-dehydrorhamnose reductase
MKIAVTGAYGQLGSELCRLLDSDAIPLEIDNLDLTDGPAVDKTLRDLRPGAVINCAAYTQADRAESQAEAARAVNATAVGHLARVCGRLDCPLVQISTDYVFGGQPDRTTPYREDEQPSPRGVYAQTKLEGERAAARQPKHLIVRTCGLYARPADERAGNFVKTMLRLGSSGSEPRGLSPRKELRVVADQHCTPSYVPHVARAILFLLGLPRAESAPWGVYHVTNRGATTWYEFAGEIFRLAGMEVLLEAISTAEYAAAAPRPAYSVLDTAKYHALGGPAMPAWQDALQEYFA